MPELAFINGEIFPIEKAVTNIEDRGYQFADAVYEVIGGCQGNLFRLEQHLARLERSCSEIKIEPPPREYLRSEIHKLCAKSEIANPMVYIQLSRGVAPRNHLFPENAKLQFVMTVRPIRTFPEEYRTIGINCITVPDIRWGRCDVKTVNLLPNVLAKQEAHDAGCVEAIFIGPNGEVREATSANLFAVFNNALWTHPRTNHILPGITREVILEIAAKNSISIYEEVFFRKDMMNQAQEIFITGTTAEIIPIIKIDGKIVGGGKRGPITDALDKAFQALLLKGE